jgi:hypothetical protein
MKQRIVITLDGGLVQDIYTDGLDVEVYVVDYDTDGADPADLKTVGKAECFVGGDYGSEVNADFVNAVATAANKEE